MALFIEQAVQKHQLFYTKRRIVRSFYTLQVALK